MTRSLALGLVAAVLLPFAAAPNCIASILPTRGKPPVLARSADDPALQRSLMALGPNVSAAEAKLVASVAFETGRHFAKQWGVVWPPGLHNLLVNRGSKKGGLCFQWATELAPRLEALNLKTLKLHWAESYLGTSAEHNVIVVTAIGGSFSTGILLDNWRYSGQLAWGRVVDDREYKWKDNPAQLAAALNKPASDRRAAGGTPSRLGAAGTTSRTSR